MELRCGPGEKVVFRGVKYRGEVEVNVMGVWEWGEKEPLWVMTTLDPEEALRLYRQRMKIIEEAFRDLKSLLGLEKVMSKKREMMEKLIGFLLLVYGFLLLFGEELRQELFRRKGSSRWKRYSGLFILLKTERPLPPPDQKRVFQRVLNTYLQALYPCVRTHG